MMYTSGWKGTGKNFHDSIMNSIYIDTQARFPAQMPPQSLLFQIITKHVVLLCRAKNEPPTRVRGIMHDALVNAIIIITS